VGATGSGKSTTVASILAAISDRRIYPSARVLVIDIHGEYRHALEDRSAVFRVTPELSRDERQLYVPYWAMTFDELVPIIFGKLDDPNRGAVIDKIVELKTESLGLFGREGVDAETVNVDTPVPFSIHKLWFDLHCDMRATHYERPGIPQSVETWALALDADSRPIQKGDMMRGIPPRFLPARDIRDDPVKIRLSRSNLSMSREIDSLGSKLRDPRFSFLLSPGPYGPTETGAVDQDLDSLLESWLGDVQPVSILDLSGVPPVIQSEIVGAVLRITYDSLFWARNLPEGGRERPLLLVLEEAHTYLETGQTAAVAVRRIAKEGRKYGIGMMLVSQRPSEIDSTILSQCGTIISLRLSNGADRNHVRGAASDNLEGLFAALPVLRTGEVVIVGEAVSLPVRALVTKPSARRRPDSADPKVVVEGSEDDGFEGPGGWNQKRDPSDYAEAVELWRRQSARSLSVQQELPESSGSNDKRGNS
jgi:hypothetical protein